MGPPSAKQINVHDSLDERWACKHFLGKTVEQAEVLFRENAQRYQEALMWMGSVAFRYYVTAFIRYLQSEHANGDADAASCFQSLLDFKLEHQRQHLASCEKELASACRYVLAHFEKFRSDPTIDGDLRSRHELLAAKLELLSTA